MLIEFETVVSSRKEDHERSILEETLGHAKVPFHKERDYISTCAVEINDVVGYDVGDVWYNSERRETLYAKLKDGEYTRNLLISAEDFKKVYRNATGKVIVNHREI